MFTTQVSKMPFAVRYAFNTGQIAHKKGRIRQVVVGVELVAVVGHEDVKPFFEGRQFQFRGMLVVQPVIG